MSKFQKQKQQNAVLEAFKPIFDLVGDLSNYVSIFFTLTKSSYSLDFYIINEKGKRVFSGTLQETGQVDGNDQDKAAEKTAKNIRSMRPLVRLYEEDMLNVYTIILRDSDATINISAYNDTGKERRDAYKEWSRV